MSNSWPDGTLKWTGHALAADSALEESVTLAPGDPTEPAASVKVTKSASNITITTGSFTGAPFFIFFISS
jgi:hypothetical protein